MRATEVQYFYVDIGSSPVSFALSEHPTITYEGDQLTIATSDRSISLPPVFSSRVRAYEYGQKKASLRHFSR